MEYTHSYHGYETHAYNMSACRARLNHLSPSRAHGYALLVTLRYRGHHREIDISHKKKTGQQIQTCVVNVICSLPPPFGLLTVCRSPCLRSNTHIQDRGKRKAFMHAPASDYHRSHVMAITVIARLISTALALTMYMLFPTGWCAHVHKKTRLLRHCKPVIKI